MTIRKTLTCLVALGLCFGGSAFAGVTFIDLGDAQATGISQDGTIVVGVQGASAFRWTMVDGVVNIGGNFDISVGISPDGSTIVGDVDDAVDGTNTAAFWLSGTDWQGIGGLPNAEPCGDDLSSAMMASDNGDIIVGSAWDTCSFSHAIAYEDGVMTDLGAFVATDSSRANSITPDGSVIVGWDGNGRDGVRWVDGVEMLLDDNAEAGEAFAVTPDGSVIVGGGAPGAPGEAYRWTEAGGAVAIGVLPGFLSSAQGFDVSDDGAVVVGASGFGFDRDAFYWTEGTGMLLLDDYLESISTVDLSLWRLGSATAISGDGRTIAGWGLGPDFFTQSWVAIITAPELSITGTCPDVTVSALGGTPDGEMIVVRGAALGSTTIPTGACAGTELGLDNAQRLSTVTADSLGDFSFTTTVPAGACGQYLQFVDLSTCTVSDAVQLQ